MHTLLDRTDLENETAADREISLGTANILGIFFALALVIAGFFGFGYTLGRKSAQDSSAPSGAYSGSNFSSFKPAAGSLPGQPQAAPVAAPIAAMEQPTPLTPPPPSVVVNTQAPAQTPSATTEQTAPRSSAETASNAAPKPVAAPPLAPAPNLYASGNFVVQVAAVSNQDLADIELATLKKKGYNVVVRNEPQDKFLHVVIGPFAARRDAEAMRLRVLDDGFNAIVK
jgi:DedD protein